MNHPLLGPLAPHKLTHAQLDIHLGELGLPTDGGKSAKIDRLTAAIMAELNMNAPAAAPVAPALTDAQEFQEPPQEEPKIALQGEAPQQIMPPHAPGHSAAPPSAPAAIPVAAPL